MKKFGILVAVLALLGIYGCSTYNGLVKADESVKTQWAQVESQYQRRADLIPNLVNVVKGYAQHERGVFEEVAKARAQVGSIRIDATKLDDPATMQKFEQAQNTLAQAMKSLLAVSERYPDLKAEPRFGELQSQIEGTENRIAVERKRYNESVQAYNVVVRTFPTRFIAGMTGFAPKTPFAAITPGAEQAPKVEF